MNQCIITRSLGDYNVLDFVSKKLYEIDDSKIRVKIIANSINNTDINTRIGWYSKDPQNMSGYNGPSPFPLIQGTDAYGQIVEIGKQVKTECEIGDKVLMRCSTKKGWYGSDFNGFYQDYIDVEPIDVYVIKSKLSDTQLGAIGCAYGTAENMLLKASIKENDIIVVPGGSGGVATAVIDLALLRKNTVVYALVGHNKKKYLEEHFKKYKNRLYVYETNPSCKNYKLILEEIKKKKVSLVVDNVGGVGTNSLIEILDKNGRYVTSGAIGGEYVTIDIRTVYLNDLQIIGSTEWLDKVMDNLVIYINENKINPLIAKTFSLKQIVDAQQFFLIKDVNYRKVGKVVIMH